MSAPGLWDDPDRARGLNRELAKNQRIIDTAARLDQMAGELELFLECASDTPADLEEVQKSLEALQGAVADVELASLLSGEYDDHNAILSVHAGAGGTDAQDWAEMILRMYLRWAEERGFESQVVEASAGEEAGLKSATVIIRGDRAYGYLIPERGVHRLVRLSPFDAAHRRHTSFAQVEVIPEIEEAAELEIDPDDLVIDTYRSSGAGGQHVNKTDSAVRITHTPTGLVVQCQNERSQHSNRLTAMKILKARLFERQREEQEKKLAQLRGERRDIAWGSQIRSYVLHPYTLVKDLRTGQETGSVQAVLDGRLDPFIRAYLEWNAQGRPPRATGE